MVPANTLCRLASSTGTLRGLCLYIPILSLPAGSGDRGITQRSAQSLLGLGGVSPGRSIKGAAYSQLPFDLNRLLGKRRDILFPEKTKTACQQ
jgi:hypothetical protein